MYFKPIFVHLTQVTAQAVILETSSAAVVETWLLLHMSVATEFQAKEVPLVSVSTQSASQQHSSNK